MRSSNETVTTSYLGVSPIAIYSNISHLYMSAADKTNGWADSVMHATIWYTYIQNKTAILCLKNKIIYLTFQA